MTKRELIERLAVLSDDDQVYVNIEDDGDLAGITDVSFFESDGPGYPPFVTLIARVEYEAA